MLAMPSKTRNQFDLIRFLDQLDDEIPVVEDQQIEAITDNLSTRGTENVNRWLEAHPRWSSSSSQSPRRGSTRSRSSSRSCGGGCSSTASSPPSKTSP